METCRHGSWSKSKRSSDADRRKFLARYETRNRNFHYVGNDCLGGLPFFDDAIKAVWTDGPSSIGSTAWDNINGFASRLTGCGAVDLTFYGLWTISDALETPRAVTKFLQGNAVEMTIEDLLPAAISWLRHCAGLFTGRIHDSNYPNRAKWVPTTGSRPGPLALQSGVSAEGFSLARYRFWRDRLHELSLARDDSGKSTPLARVAMQGYEPVHSWRRISGDAPAPGAKGYKEGD